MRGSADQKKTIYKNDAIAFSRTSNQFIRAVGNDSLSKTGNPPALPAGYLFVVKAIRFWIKKSRNLLIKHKKITYPPSNTAPHDGSHNSLQENRRLIYG